METKNIASAHVLKFETKATLLNLNEFTETKPEELYQEAEKLGLKICGPQIWQYTGSDGKPDTVFGLEICLPVAESDARSEAFKMETLSEFKCLSMTHKGAWARLGETYAALMGECANNGLKPNGISREVYINCDFANADNCVTEVQIGIE